MGLLEGKNRVGGAASLVEMDAQCTAVAMTMLLRAMIERAPFEERAALRTVALSIYEAHGQKHDGLSAELDRLLEAVGFGPSTWTED